MQEQMYKNKSLKSVRDGLERNEDGSSRKTWFESRHGTTTR